MWVVHDETVLWWGGQPNLWIAGRENTCVNQHIEYWFKSCRMFVCGTRVQDVCAKRSGFHTHRDVDQNASWAGRDVQFHHRRLTRRERDFGLARLGAMKRGFAIVKGACQTILKGGALWSETTRYISLPSCSTITTLSIMAST